jgi:leucyl/phenylalanyl-tRNA---protein transferase
MIVAYEQLHELGFAHSIEVFQSGHLVGGLYGVAIGKVFFGESMFSRVSDASKIALATLAKALDSGQLLLVDCQVENPHLSQMGATNIPRRDFEKLLSNAIKDDQHLLAMTGTSADKLIPRSHPDWLSTIGGDPAGLLEKQL